MKGSELKKLRLSVKQTAKQAADEAGVTERSWRRWESSDYVLRTQVTYWMLLNKLSKY